MPDEKNPTPEPAAGVPPEDAVVDEALSDEDEVDPAEAAGDSGETGDLDEADEAADVDDTDDTSGVDGPSTAPAVLEAAARASAASAASAPPAEPPLDLAELGRRYEVPARFADHLRAGFRELKRHPSEAKRLPALLRGLARAHEPDARTAAEQITRLVQRIQAPAKEA